MTHPSSSPSGSPGPTPAERGERLRPPITHRAGHHLRTLAQAHEDAARFVAATLAGQVASTPTNAATGGAADSAADSFGILVDLGCGNMPYRPLYERHVKRYLGADLAGNPHADLALNEGRVPLPDGAASVVLSSQVLEHVPDVTAYLAEVKRLLAPGGMLILSTHGHWAFHPDPGDYWRWTSMGLRKIVEEAGFRVLRFEGVMGVPAVGVQYVQDAVEGRLPWGLRQVFIASCQWGAALLDRMTSPASRARDAAVFLVVATPMDSGSHESSSPRPAR